MSRDPEVPVSYAMYRSPWAAVMTAGFRSAGRGSEATATSGIQPEVGSPVGCGADRPAEARGADATRPKRRTPKRLATINIVVPKPAIFRPALWVRSSFDTFFLPRSWRRAGVSAHIKGIAVSAQIENDSVRAGVPRPEGRSSRGAM